MPNLVIGHTTHRAATLWVRGDAKHPHAHLALTSPDGATAASRELALDPEHDFTGAATLDGLDPQTSYGVQARFRRRGGDAGAGAGAAEISGRLRTFPPPGTPARLVFLLGSCNLSVVSLANLGSLVGGGVGALAGARSLERPRGGGRLLRVALWVGNSLAYLIYRAIGRRQPPEGDAKRREWERHESLAWGVLALIFGATGFKQTRPFLPSAYRTLVSVADRDASAEPPPPAFVLHAGDQIYFDFPWAEREPGLEAYRRAYREAWFEDEWLRRFLTHCPHYMILDDHEIVDGFALDAELPRERPADAYLEPARRAYREYVHARQPGHDGALSYDFAYGDVRFFVLDTRTRRSIAKGEMIDPRQMECLKAWLEEHARAVKFVVSSVPFVAQVRSRPKEGSRARDERDDKWSGPAFRRQREEILTFLHDRGIGRVVFLVGDMHCCYHATGQVGRPHDRITVHELAGGPFQQLQFGCRNDFVEDHRDGLGDGGTLPFRSVLRELHGSASAALQVDVRPGAAPEIRWQVIRTSPEPPRLADPGTDASAPGAAARPAAGDAEEERTPIRPLSGRIGFEELRHS